jgi:hypothetical protein
MKRLFPIAATSLALLCGGCALWPFSKKSADKDAPPKPKQSSRVSTDVELGFRQRWVDKRTADLVAQGMVPDAAHAQALAEFRVKFSYTHAASMP